MSRGFVTLLSVLVVGAVGSAIAVSVILLGLGSSRSSFVLTQSNQAKALANTCAEEALEQIRGSTPYTGSSGLTLGSGSCTYTVISTGGTSRTITSTGTVGTVVRKVRVLVTAINPQIQLSSWQEVADF